MAEVDPLALIGRRLKLQRDARGLQEAAVRAYDESTLKHEVRVIVF